MYELFDTAKTDDLRRKKSLDEAREEFREELDAGTVCPCCHRAAKRYKRKLNSSKARALIWMWVNHRYNWVNVAKEAPRHVCESREYSKLALWGLIERKTNAKGQSNHWRVTDRGAQFVRNCITVERFVYVYNNVVDEDTYETDRVNILDALTDHFDYRELMGFTNE